MRGWVKWLVAAVAVAFPALASAEGANPFLPPDPNGFAGNWVEYWGNDASHDASTVFYVNGKYYVQVTSPNTGPLRISDVRLDGNALRFVENLTSVAIQYEVHVQDANTLVGKTQDNRGSSNVTWRRQTPESLKAGPTLTGFGDLVVTLAWATPGADVDLLVTGPDGRTCTAATNCTNGPGQEIVTIPNPANGAYVIDAQYVNGAQAALVVADVRRGGQVAAKCSANLAQRGDRAHVFTVNLNSVAAGPAAATAHTRLDKPQSRLTPDQVTEVLRSLGIQARLEKLQTGNPIWYFKLGNYNADLVAFSRADMHDGAYDSLTLHASFQAPPADRKDLLQRANEWNLKTRQTRAYVEKDNACVLDADCDFLGGASVDALKQIIPVYQKALDDFAARVLRP